MTGTTTTRGDAAAPAGAGFKGNDTLLFGIVLAVLTFWLFAGTMGTVAPEVLDSLNSQTERVSAQQMNFAVSVTALFSGLFTVAMVRWVSGRGLAASEPELVEVVALLGLVCPLLDHVLRDRGALDRLHPHHGRTESCRCQQVRGVIGDGLVGERHT